MSLSCICDLSSCIEIILKLYMAVLNVLGTVM